MRNPVRLFIFFVAIFCAFISLSGFRLGALGRRSRRIAVFAAQPDHAGQCRQSRPRLGVSHRRSRHPRARGDEADQVSGHPAVGRRQPDLLLAVQRSHRARSRQRRAEMAVRSEDLDRAAPGQPLQLPWRGLLGRRQGGRDGRLPRADLHGYQRRARDRARREVRHSLRRFRRQWRDQDRDRHAAGMARRIPDHVGARDCPRHRHRRLCDRGQPPRRGATRHGARLRCANRAAALEFRSAGA